MAKINLEALEKKPSIQKQTKDSKRQRFIGKEKKEQIPIIKEKKGKKKKESSWKKKSKELNTRSIKFNYIQPKKMAAFFIWSIILVFLFSSFLFIVRQNSIASAIRKNSEQLTALNELTSEIEAKNEYLSYQGETFLRLYFSEVGTGEAEQIRKERISSLLSRGLSLSQVDLGEEPLIESISFVNQKTKKNKTYGEIVELSYDVLLSVKQNISKNQNTTQKKEVESIEQLSERELVSLQVTLTTTKNEKDFRLIATPVLSNFSKERIEDVEEVVEYNSSALLSRGGEVPEDKRKSILSFVEQFYELYTQNNVNLKLVTNATGFTSPATAESISIVNMVELSEGLYAVDGTATLYYEDTNIKVPTTFSLEMKQTEKNYFVTKINE